MGKGTTVEAPKPSAQEIEIQKQQLEILKEQRAESELLKPFILQSMQLTETEEGGLRRLSEEEYLETLTPTQQTAFSNLKLQQERQTKALKGELPITEGTLQRKQEEFERFREAMARKGTPISGDTLENATGTSTSAIQALKAFKERWQLVESAERQGELTTGQSAILQSMGVASDIGQRRISNLAQFPQRQTGTFQAFSQALQPYQYQRGLVTQADIASARSSATETAGLYGAIGTGAGILAGIAL